MNREALALLKLKNIKQSLIAERLNVSPAAVCRVLAGESESRRIKKAIARALKMKYKDLWDEKAA